MIKRAYSPFSASSSCLGSRRRSFRLTGTASRSGTLCSEDSTGKVEIGLVHFNLFTGPGFTIENVVIYDDPSAGIEPFAHMLELQARVGLSSLFTGRLDFSVLRFVSPSVNIVKPGRRRLERRPTAERRQIQRNRCPRFRSRTAGSI